MVGLPRTSRISLFIAIIVAWTAIIGCSPDADSPTPDDRLTSEQLQELTTPIHTAEFEDRSQIEELFASQIARFEPGEAFRQVYWVTKAADLSDLQYRIPNADGHESHWRDVEIRFDEDSIIHALVRLDAPVRAIEFRGGQGIEQARIHFNRVVTARDDDGQPPAWLRDTQTADVPDVTDRDVSSVQQAIAPDSLVISQSDWGSDEPGKVCGVPHNPDRMTIHHTAIPSDDGGDPAARMRGMQTEHKNLGWCDIGYHFVVSQSGNIYQGRSMSSRTGAHAYNYNSNNVGISLIGNYNVDSPPQVQLDSAAQIMEWVHDEHGVALNRNVIKGHQEWPYQSTSCPGTNLLNQLEDLIDNAANDPGNSGPAPDPDPAPQPGGCTPTADDDATNSVFADFPTDATGYDEALRLYNHQITDGCNASPLKFCPNCELTRSQMAVFLARAANLDTSDPPSTPSFDDVSPDSYAYPYIEAIYDAGVTSGCEANKFCPDQTITRAQGAAMVHFAQGWPDEVPATGPTFSDIDTEAYYYEAVETLHQRCVTDGCGGDEFCPGQSLTRAQGAAFVSRAFNLDDSNPCAVPGGCSPQPAFDAQNSLFSDFPTDEFGYDEAELIYDEGITQGCTDEEFCPKCPTTRRQMVSFLVRGLDLDTSNPPAQPTFDDVSPTADGYGEIEAAYQAGIINGCGDDNFCPDDDVTRDQTATLFTRALGWPELDPATPSFDDVDVDHPHYVGIETFQDRCITDGCGDGEFCPDGRVPRSHAAIFVARAFDLDGINSCAATGGGGAAPQTDVDGAPGTGDDGSDDSTGDSCQDVDPDFVDASCGGNDDGPSDGGDGDDSEDDNSEGDDSDGDSSFGGDDDGDVSVQGGGCTTTSQSPATPLMVIALLAAAAGVMRNRRTAAP